MTRSPRRWAVLCLSATIAALAVGVAILGVGHTVVISAVLAAVAAVTLAGTEWLIRARGRGVAAAISTQLALVIALVIGPLVLALVVLGLAMFVSGRDAALVGVIVALSGVIGVAAVTRLSGGLSTDLAEIREGLLRVGAGEREVRVGATSAAELAELAAGVNTTIAALAREEAARAASEEARAASEEARRQLVAHASHDLRTPVTSLRLLAAAVDDEVVDGSLRRDYVRRMLTHIEALSALIDDLFELSRLQAGDITWTLDRVALGDLVDETVEAMQVQAEARGVAVCADLPSALAPALGNPEKLQRVLFNLIQNAIRHSPADGTVVVRAEHLADMIEVEVEDRGGGIPPAEREQIFDPFYRGGEDTSRSGEGAGLGLAVARAIVDAHGGEIWLAPAAVGTRVRFSVPIAA